MRVTCTILVPAPKRIDDGLRRLSRRWPIAIATDVFMGGRGKDSSAAVSQALIATVRAASSLVRAPLPGTRSRAGVRGRRVLEQYFARHPPSARAGHSDDLFAALCHASTEDGERISDGDVINHMIFLMMAAHDTSTITTTAVTTKWRSIPSGRTGPAPKRTVSAIVPRRSMTWRLSPPWT
jgi:cytochrome P450